jgi:hypothetical protein
MILLSQKSTSRTHRFVSLAQSPAINSFLACINYRVMFLTSVGSRSLRLVVQNNLDLLHDRRSQLGEHVERLEVECDLLRTGSTENDSPTDQFRR